MNFRFLRASAMVRSVKHYNFSSSRKQLEKENRTGKEVTVVSTHQQMQSMIYFVKSVTFLILM